MQLVPLVSSMERSHDYRYSIHKNIRPVARSPAVRSKAHSRLDRSPRMAQQERSRGPSDCRDGASVHRRSDRGLYGDQEFQEESRMKDELKKCEAHPDCFANRGQGYCRLLTSTVFPSRGGRYEGDQCPFYKSAKQFEAEAEKYAGWRWR